MLKDLMFEAVGDPITNGLRISWLPDGELEDGSNVFRRWPNKGFGGWRVIVGVEGSEMGCFLAMSGGALGDATEDDELPEEVLVSIFSRGGAIGRLGGGVDEAEVGGLGLLKIEGGVCITVDEASGKKLVPLTLGAFVVAGGRVNKGIVGVGPRVDLVAPLMG